MDKNLQIKQSLQYLHQTSHYHYQQHNHSSEPTCDILIVDEWITGHMDNYTGLDCTPKDEGSPVGCLNCSIDWSEEFLSSKYDSNGECFGVEFDTILDQFQAPSSSNMTSLLIITFPISRLNSL